MQEADRCAQRISTNCELKLRDLLCVYLIMLGHLHESLRLCDDNLSRTNPAARLMTAGILQRTT